MSEYSKPVRSREAQEDSLAYHLGGLQSADKFRLLARAMIAESEARGAAEQRRKDAEGQEPYAWGDVTFMMKNRPFTAYLKPPNADPKFNIPLYTHPANVAALEDAEGYLFSNPDTGTEYLPYHPIESGECQYAENIRKATNSELLSELQVVWKGWEEDRAGKAALEGRIAELEKENAALESAVMKAAESVMGIETPCMKGDNLAVTICSYFEDSEGEPCDNGWHEGATNAYEEIKSAIIKHFRDTLTRTRTQS